MKKKVYILLIAFATIFVGWKTFRYWQATHAPQQQAAAQAVDVIVASTHQVYPEASFVAKIEAPDIVGLRARVTGFLQERLVQDGDLVKKDQPIFIIEPVNFETAVRQAEANLAKAEATATNAKAQYNRTESLYKTKDVSEAKRDESKAAYETATATVNQMKALLDLAKKDLEYTTVVSPMDGKIGESEFSVGELIGPDSGVLATIVSVDPMDAVFSISENQLLSLLQQFGKDDAVEAFFIYSDGRTYEHKGSIDFIDVALDEAMNTLKIKASFPNQEGHLISGQYGRILIKGHKLVDKIVVPMKAVQRDLKEAFVYIVDNENKIVKTPVKEGLELPDFQVVIEDGLSGGEQVVVAGFQKIAPQMTVTPNVIAE